MAELIDRDAVAYKLKSCITIPADSEWDSGYNTAMAEAKQYIQNAPAVNRWISVEDALPEIGYNVLVTRQTESNARYIRIASRQDDCWIDSTDEYGKPNPHPVIAWMPMPDAYKPPEKEDDNEHTRSD